MKRPLLQLSLLPTLLFAACSIGEVPRPVRQVGETMRTLRHTSPPQEFGRPGWVRFFASAGGVIGGAVGGVVSVVMLPISYPLSLLAEDELDQSAGDQFLLWPANTMAAFGHAALGFPADALDFAFHRAWLSRTGDPVLANNFTAFPEPLLPQLEKAPDSASQPSGSPAAAPPESPQGK